MPELGARGRTSGDRVAVGDASLLLDHERRPHPGPGLRIEELRARRRADLRPVALDPDDVRGGAVQYWMWNGVAAARDDARMSGRDARYELTIMADRPLGRERPKTSGHRHVRPAPGRPIFPEVCQVLAGTAAFLLQDLEAGPAATYAALVVVEPGEWIVLPPGLHHGTISLRGEPVIFADVIDRRAAAEYASLASARGFAHLVLTDGSTVPNPAYVHVPPLEHWTASTWSSSLAGSLYERYRDDPAEFRWLSEPEEFARRFPEFARWLRPILARSGEPL